MKQLRTLFLAVVGLLCSVSASAYDFEVDSIYYTVTSEVDKMVEVAGSRCRDVIIPESVSYNENTYKVTRIGDKAFYRGNKKSIEISNSVTTIGKEAFRACRGLSSVEIPNSVTSIEEAAFCESYLTSVTIGNGVTRIGDKAFYNSRLKTVTIGSGVTSIGNQAFVCGGLKVVLNSSNLTFTKGSSEYGRIAYYADVVVNKYDGRIDDYIFTKVNDTIFLQEYIGTETELVLPQNYKDGNYAIGDTVFLERKELTSVVIPNSVISIGKRAFQRCWGLTSVEIPNSVTCIGVAAFSYCIGLTSVTIGNSVTNIGDYAFAYCFSLTSVEIPNSVTTIGDYAFDYCENLTSVTIGKGVTSIGKGAFAYNTYHGHITSVKIEDVSSWCKIKFGDWQSNPLYRADLYINGEKVTDLVIPNGVTSIESYAFYYCESLTSIVIPNSVTSIGSRAFLGCRNVTSMTIGDSVTEIGWEAFDGTVWYKNHPDGVVYLGNYLLGYKGTMPENINIKDGTTLIADQALAGIDNLTSVQIPNSVTSIGEGAFGWCFSLTSVEIPNSVTSIGGWVFIGCSDLNSIIVAENNPVYDSREGCNAIIESKTNTLIAGCNTTTIPNSVTCIGDSAFYGSNIPSVLIPNSVTSIGDCAFERCFWLSSIIVSENNPVYDSRDNCNAIIESKTNTLIAGCKATIIPNSVTSIGDGAFRHCDSLTSVDIPNNVLSIGDYAFYNCDSLTSVTIGNSVTNIGDYAFYNCNSLTSVEIPNSVTSIGREAFYGCKNIERLYIGSEIETIGDLAFYYCDSLQNIQIASMEAIPARESIFSSTTYGNAFLWVPRNCGRIYDSTSPWNKFSNIREMDFTAIDDVIRDNNTSKVYYDLNGRVVTNPTKGIYILNGKKVLVK